MPIKSDKAAQVLQAIARSCDQAREFTPLRIVTITDYTPARVLCEKISDPRPMALLTPLKVKRIVWIVCKDRKSETTLCS